MENLHRGNSPTWLTVKRILFGAVFVLMVGYLLFSNESPPRSDSVLYLCAAFLIFLSLWWKPLYLYRHHDALIATAIPMVLFLASWIRHGPYTVVSGELAVFLLILLVAYLYLNGGEPSNRE